MKLPHLDQLVPLDRGDAGVLAKALAVLVRDVTHATKPVSYMQAITLPALAALTKKLATVHHREQERPVVPNKRPKPRNFRVSYDQMAVLMHSRAPLHYCGLDDIEQLQLQVVLGKFHQKSLNLSTWIKFS
jgi:hypothetical protein